MSYIYMNNHIRASELKKNILLVYTFFIIYFSRINTIPCLLVTFVFILKLGATSIFLNIFLIFWQKLIHGNSPELFKIN